MPVEVVYKKQADCKLQAIRILQVHVECKEQVDCTLQSNGSQVE